jgi:hypothetical protein
VQPDRAVVFTAVAKGDKKTEKEPERVWARVTVGMAGARRGQRVLVNPEDPAMAEMIASDLVVLEEADAE